jgi:hypothetical protein
MGFANSQNKLPPFIVANGPAREARFIKNPDGTPDGGVHAVFTIGGRPDQLSGCNLTQRDCSRSSNIIPRIPTPTFGLGLIEAIPDSTLVQNLASSGGGSVGISGRLNRNGNDGTVTRFGWKAQNKSLLSSPPKRITSRWVSRTCCSPTSGMKPRTALQLPLPTTFSTLAEKRTPRFSTTS